MKVMHQSTTCQYYGWSPFGKRKLRNNSQQVIPSVLLATLFVFTFQEVHGVNDISQFSSFLQENSSIEAEPNLYGNISFRQDELDDEDDDDGGGAGGGGGFISGASSAISQINSQTMALVFNFLPQVFSTFSRFGEVANMALNGTDTPDIRSFLVKHGQSAVKLFKSFANGPTTEDPYFSEVPLSLRDADRERIQQEQYPIQQYEPFQATPIPYPPKIVELPQPSLPQQPLALYSYPKLDRFRERETNIMRELLQLQKNLDAIKKTMPPNNEPVSKPVMKASINLLMNMLSHDNKTGSGNASSSVSPSLWSLYSDLVNRREHSSSSVPISFVVPTKNKSVVKTTYRPQLSGATSLPPKANAGVSKAKPLYWMNMFYPNGLQSKNTTSPKHQFNKVSEPLMRVSPKLRGFPTRFPPRTTKFAIN